MFQPYWVILRQRIYWKELLLHCFASSRWIVISTSYFAPCLRPLYVVEGEPLILLCVLLCKPHSSISFLISQAMHKVRASKIYCHFK
jgi:hypothetical protein